MNLKSIRNNFGANGLTFILNTIFQFVSVPLFLTFWGVDLYGEWLVLFSLTAYFAMSDVGLNTVTINEFTISFTRDDLERCHVLLNNTLLFIGFVFLALVVVMSLSFLFLDYAALLHLNQISERTAELVVFCLLVQVFVNMAAGVFDAIFRATNRNAQGVMINNGIRLIENILLIVLVVLKVQIDLLILVYITPKIIGFFYKYYKAKKYFPIQIGFRFFQKLELKKLLVPAFSFMSFPVGNSIILQGFTLLVNFTLGSAAVVVYNTTRTFINFTKVGLGLINSSVWPEFSIAYGKKDFTTMKKMHQSFVALAFYFAVVACFAFMIFGENVFAFWTNNRVPFNTVLFFSFLLTLISNSVWNTSSVVLASTNKHEKFSLLYLGSCLLALVIGYAILKITNQLDILPLSLFIVDVVLIGFVIRNALKIVRDDFPSFFKHFVYFPIFFILNFKKLLAKVFK